jgi:uncharacterized membrane protein YjfL (UPF0719 family)
MGVGTQLLLALGWGLAGAVAMAAALALLLKVFTWLTPLDEWAELRGGNLAVAIVLAAVVVGFAVVVAAALPSRVIAG